MQVATLGWVMPPFGSVTAGEHDWAMRPCAGRSTTAALEADSIGMLGRLVTCARHGTLHDDAYQHVDDEVDARREVA